MDLLPIAEQLSDPAMHFYLCGPVGFMQHIAEQLVSMGVAVERVHYEVFGPHKVL